MNYHLKSKPRHENRPKVFMVIGLFLFLSALAFLFPNGIRTVTETIAKPIWLLSDVATKPFVGIKEFFVFKKSLIATNLSLEEELSDLKLKQVDYDSLVKDNQDLKAQLGFRATTARVISHVLSKPPLSPYDTFVIDTGSSDGIIIGDKVYLSEGVIIGFVTNTIQNSSLVQLFSSGGYKQEAILSRTGAYFVLIGKGGANFQLEVPKDTDILWGDVFTYPGVSASLGSVYYIDSNSQSSFKTIYIRMLGNVFQSKFVFVE